MEDFIEKNRNKPNSFHSKLFSLKEFKLKEESLDLRFRSNSCIIPSIQQIENCLDFVPKLK